MHQFWLIAGNIALIGAAAITTTLVFVYGVLTTWERTRVGRQFMLTKLCLAVILDFVSAATIFSSRPQMYTPLTPLRFFIYGAVALVMLRWLIIILQTQRTTRKGHPVWNAPEEPPPVRRES